MIWGWLQSLGLHLMDEKWCSSLWEKTKERIINWDIYQAQEIVLKYRDGVMEEVKRRRAESVWLHMKESERKVFHIRWLWEREMTTNVIGGDSNDRDDNNYCRFVNWKCLQSMPHWCYDIVGNSQHFSMWLLGASLIAAFRRFILESL